MDAKSLACAVLVLLGAACLASGQEYWVEPMREVHSNFNGHIGAVARFGDSITYSSAFFRPLQWSFINTTAEDDAALTWIHGDMYAPAWDWQEDAQAYGNGCYSGTTSTWPLQVEQHPSDINIDYWLDKLQPEAAVIMWGTNDLHQGRSVADYTSNMRQVVQACKTHGTVPILTAIPPRRGYVTESAAYAQAMRDLALEQEVPLIDYHDEILTRQPGTSWDGTLISADGVHPSWGQSDASNFSQTALSSYGYTLRNWMTLHKCYEVYNEVLVHGRPAQATISVFDVSGGDVPGPQPIRAFPVPAAANWPQAQLIFDNHAEGLIFSPDNNPSTWNWVDLPVGNADVTIHGVTNDPLDPQTDDSFDLYTNVEGSDGDGRADDRFGYHVPRLARYHGVNFLSVRFDLARPATQFGVYLPASSNSWGTDPGQYFDEQNFVKQDRAVWVIIFGEGDTIETAQTEYVSLRADGQDSYCPFLKIDWNGSDRITSVCIIHDVVETTDKGVGFMDVYVFDPAWRGDFTADGCVDGADYTAWADNYEQSGGPGDGDATGDGFIDGADYTAWADNYGQGCGLAGDAVPEPSCAAVWLCGLWALRRRRRKG